MNFSSSKQLIINTKFFLKIDYYSFFDKVFKKKGIFYGWGRKKSGLKAISLAHKRETSFVLLEDGFIRSLDLGVNNSPSFSLVEDNIGIYYDATSPSTLENILNTYDFISDKELVQKAKEAIEMIIKNNISKYNHAPNLSDGYFKNKNKRVLVIAQTAGDSSLEYGMIDNYSTEEMIEASLSENPNAEVYVKIHPDVLSGKKKSDINIEDLKNKCKIIEENINPISLLKHFDKVYTKTSQMGFEALLVGCECVCFGMPFYAGWGFTSDKSICERRKRKLFIEEVFAGAYILYTRYYNPYKKKDCDIIEAIEEIIYQRNIGEAKCNG